MFGIRLPSRRAARDEAEKPFWISFSDLMTALMVLFLVAMTVALLAITQKITAGVDAGTQRNNDIDSILIQINEEAVKNFPGITVDVKGRSIDFHERAYFDTDSHKLTETQSSYLRAFVSKVVLPEYRNPLGKKWIKRIVVEGFADQRGTYLHNLNLSLERSERVLCALLASPQAVPDALSEEDRLLVRELFLVGGSSFNSLKESLEKSRRIELKLEFLEIGERRATSRNIPLDNDPRCPID